MYAVQARLRPGWADLTLIIKRSKEGRSCSSIVRGKTLPEAPVMSIFLRFLHSRMPTVSFPEVGTYRSEKQISPKYCKKVSAE
jgi:hypothetical protein